MKEYNSTQNIVIGMNSLVSGAFFVKGNINIAGIYEGSVLEAEQVTIESSGIVKANIVVNSIIISGTIVGNIVASARVMLMPTAKVIGDITTKELIIQDGVILEGACHINSNKTTIDQIREEIINSFQNGLQI